jgi:hypothetical protein
MISVTELLFFSFLFFCLRDEDTIQAPNDLLLPKVSEIGFDELRAILVCLLPEWKRELLRLICTSRKFNRILESFDL